MSQYEQRCEHHVHVQTGKIWFRDSIGPAASLERYCTKDTRSLRLVSPVHERISAAGGLRHPEPKKLFKNCDNWFNVIEEWPTWMDLAPSDFWLFPTLKMGLKGKRFATLEDTKSNATAELRKIPKEAFRRCFQQWQDRQIKCVCAQGS